LTAARFVDEAGDIHARKFEMVSAVLVNFELAGRAKNHSDSAATPAKP